MSTVNWTIQNKFQWNLYHNKTIFIQENQFENVGGKMTAILSRLQCVKDRVPMCDINWHPTSSYMVPV